MMETLFNGNNTYDYLQDKLKSLSAKIKKLSDDDFAGTSLEDWKLYFLEDETIEQLKFFKNNINTTTPKNIQIKKDTGLSFAPGLPNEYILLDGFEFDIEIPFSGSLELVYLKPRTIKLTYEKVDKIGYDNKTKYNSFVYKVRISENEIDNFDLDAFVENKIENLDYYTSQINDDILKYNNKLPSIIEDYINRRQESFKKSLELQKKLKLPLKDSNNNFRLVKLINKSKTKRPNKKHYDSNETYCIGNQDYESIINEIDSYYGGIEAFPDTIKSLDEEGLRNLVLPVLKSKFKIATTGETFRFSGKTDILLEFENRAAFIGECKIWHGIKAFDEAVNQLFGYTTWRDTKVSVIIFNKKNKDFRLVLKEIESHLMNKKNFKINKIGQYFFQELNEKDNSNMSITVQVFNYFLNN